MKNLHKGDLVKIELSRDLDENLMAWSGTVMSDADIAAVWACDQTYAIVEDAGLDWVDLILHSGRRISKLNKRRVRLISAL